VPETPILVRISPQSVVPGQNATISLFGEQFSPNGLSCRFGFGLVSNLTYFNATFATCEVQAPASNQTTTVQVGGTAVLWSTVRALGFYGAALCWRW
jgi:hypothetical protein